MQAPSARPVSARLRAEPPATREALSAEARAQEEAALIAQLTAHRAHTALGTKKADALSAKLSGIRLQLTKVAQEETPTK